MYNKFRRNNLHTYKKSYSLLPASLRLTEILTNFNRKLYLLKNYHGIINCLNKSYFKTVTMTDNQESLQMRYLKLRESALKCEQNPFGPEPVEWNDALFISKYVNELNFKRPQIYERIKFCKSFLNYYCYNKTCMTSNELIYGMMGGVTLPKKPNKFLINEKFFDGTKLLENPGNFEKINSGSEREWKSSCGPTVTLGTTSSASNSGANLAYRATRNAGVKEVDLWYDKLWEYLELPVNGGIYNALTIGTINYLGFIAIKLLSVCVKDARTVSLSIVQLSYEKFADIWVVPLRITRTPPPHKDMMLEFERSFSRFSHGSMNSLTMLLYSCLWDDSKDSSTIQTICHAGGFFSLSYVGLGCYGWLKKAHESTNTDVSVLLGFIGDRFYTLTREAIMDVMRKYGDQSKEKSWPWARLFEDRALQSISTKANPRFAATFMVVATNADLDSPLWNIPQFKKYINQYLDFKVNCHAHGQAILKRIKEDKKKEDPRTNTFSMAEL